jgi:micrococcal nuclease|tara:strand:+ start:35 stop:394 length:360 start_codon:yes stop_codon:yes gene_type:complete
MYTYKIDVLRVIDGDTIDANIDLGFDISVKKRIRFLGINTPESRTRDLEEKARGLAAKARVQELLDQADEIHLTSHGVGKFGRCLGEIDFSCAEGLTMKNLNTQLVEEGHAVEYNGGKR